MVKDLVIVGSGPAGYTAAIYAARAQLNPVILGSVFFRLEAIYRIHFKEKNKDSQI